MSSPRNYVWSIYCVPIIVLCTTYTVENKSAKILPLPWILHSSKKAHKKQIYIIISGCFCLKMLSEKCWGEQIRHGFINHIKNLILLWIWYEAVGQFWGEWYDPIYYVSYILRYKFSLYFSSSKIRICLTINGICIIGRVSFFFFW